MVPSLTPENHLIILRQNRRKWKLCVSSACQGFELHETETGAATANSFGKRDKLKKYDFLLRKLNYFPR